MSTTTSSHAVIITMETQAIDCQVQMPTVNIVSEIYNKWEMHNAVWSVGLEEE